MKNFLSWIPILTIIATIAATTYMLLDNQWTVGRIMLFLSMTASINTYFIVEAIKVSRKKRIIKG